MSTDADDAERRQEEWTALLAIYGEDAVDGAPDALEWRVSLGERCGWLEVHLPLDYPSRAPPAPVIIAPGLPDAPRAALALELSSGTLRLADGTALLSDVSPALRPSPSGAAGLFLAYVTELFEEYQQTH